MSGPKPVTYTVADLEKLLKDNANVPDDEKYKVSIATYKVDYQYFSIMGQRIHLLLSDIRINFKIWDDDSVNLTGSTSMNYLPKEVETLLLNISQQKTIALYALKDANGNHVNKNITELTPFIQTTKVTKDVKNNQPVDVLTEIEDPYLNMRFACTYKQPDSDNKRQANSGTEVIDKTELYAAKAEWNKNRQQNNVVNFLTLYNKTYPSMYFDSPQEFIDKFGTMMVVDLLLDLGKVTLISQKKCTLRGVIEAMTIKEIITTNTSKELVDDKLLEDIEYIQNMTNN